MKRGKKVPKQLPNLIFFGILLALYSLMMMRLFYRQAIEYQGMYVSDMKAYIQETMGLESGYEFPYRFFFLLITSYN